MRSPASLLALGALGACALSSCGGNPAAGSAWSSVTVVASAPPDETAAPAPPAPAMPKLDPSLPAGSVALASLDVGKLDGVSVPALAGLPAAARAALEHELRLAAGALADGRISKAIALDPARPITASLSIAGPGRAAIEKLRALAGQPASPGLTGEMRRAIEAQAGLGVALRVVVPSTDASVTIGAIAAGLERLGFAVAPKMEGIDELYVQKRRSVLVAVSRAPDAVVIDAVLPSSGEGEKAAVTRGRDVLAAIRSRAPGGPHDEPLALEGAIARARYAPAQLADLSFLGGVTETLHALSSAKGDGERDVLAQEGLGEAAQVYTLLAGKSGPYFDRVEILVDGAYGSLGLVARATPGPGAVLPENVWAPSFAVGIPGAFATLDVSMPWLRSWSSIVDDPLSARALSRAAREAGPAGWLVALPQMLATTSFEPMRWFSQHAGITRRFERIAIFTPAEHAGDGHFALLTAGTSAADAACALVDPGEACAADKKLRTNAITEIDGRSAKLFQVKGRWVVLMGREKELIEKLKIEALPAVSGPARLDVPGGTLMAREFSLPAAMFADRYVSDAAFEGGRLVARLRPAPAAASAKPPTPVKKTR